MMLFELARLVCKGYGRQQPFTRTDVFGSSIENVGVY